MKSEKLSKEKNEKIFTKSERNIIISKNHSLLKVNYKFIFERNGLFMKKTKERLFNNEEKKMSQKYNKSIEFIKLLKKICLDFNNNDYNVVIKEFLER